MRTELHALLEQAPPECTPVSSLSRWLDVNRSVCHRAVAASKREGDASNVLRELPGVEGLDQFVQGFLKRGIDPAIVQRCVNAVDDYKRLIGRFGGSQSKLIRVIDTLQHAEAQGAFEDQGSETMLHRQRWHDLAVQFTGLASEAFLAIYAIRMISDEPRQFDFVGMSGNLGVTRHQRHIPLVMVRRYFQPPSKEDYHTLNGQKSDAGRLLIPEFSTSPLPQIVTRQYPTHLVQLIDPSQDAADPLDVIIAQRMTAAEPKERRKDGHKFTLLPRIPTKRLILDIHLHDSVPRGTRIGARQYFAGSMSLAGNPAERWFDRLDDLPPPRVLGRNLENTSCAGSPRHAEMSRWIFDQLGWNATEFTGYRLEVRLPLWSVEHMMHFPAPDFVPDDLDSTPNEVDQA